MEVDEQFVILRYIEEEDCFVAGNHFAIIGLSRNGSLRVMQLPCNLYKKEYYIKPEYFEGKQRLWQPNSNKPKYLIVKVP